MVSLRIPIQKRKIKSKCQQMIYRIDCKRLKSVLVIQIHHQQLVADLAPTIVSTGPTKYIIPPSKRFLFLLVIVCVFFVRHFCFLNGRKIHIPFSDVVNLKRMNLIIFVCECGCHMFLLVSDVL